jgi:hypothetical protein
MLQSCVKKVGRLLLNYLGMKTDTKGGILIFLIIN